MPSPRALLGFYREGKNISALLREERGLTHNTEEVIEIAYDLQSGSYVESMKDPAMAEHKRRYAAELAETIRGLGEVESVLEAGVGEATTLAGVLSALGTPVRAYGFDLSWSRVAVAKRWLASHASRCSSRAVYRSTCCLTANEYAVESERWRKTEPKWRLKSAGTW